MGGARLCKKVVGADVRGPLTAAAVSRRGRAAGRKPGGSTRISPRSRSQTRKQGTSVGDDLQGSKGTRPPWRLPEKKRGDLLPHRLCLKVKTGRERSPFRRGE